MDYKSLAEAAIHRREALFAKRKAIQSDPNKKADEKRGAISIIDAEMDALAAEAREYVAEGERANELRTLMQGAGAKMPGLTERAPGGLVGGESDAWRSLLPSMTEYREAIEARSYEEGTDADGGVFVPEVVASRWVDMLRANTIVLQSLPADNILPFASSDFTVPVLDSSTLPDIVAELATITEGSDEFSSLAFKARSYKDIRVLSNEILSDNVMQAGLRTVAAQAMLRKVAEVADKDLLQSDGTGTTIKGILPQGTPVTGKTSGTVAWADLDSAVEAIWSANGTPSALWLSPGAAAAVEAERASTFKVEDSPTTAQKLPRFVSTNVPAGQAVVLDTSRVFVGIRQAPTVFISEHAAADRDGVLVRVTYRIAGSYVTDAAAVQVITPGA